MKKTEIPYQGGEVVLEHKDFSEYLKDIRDYYDKYLEERKDNDDKQPEIYCLGDGEGEPTGTREGIEKEYEEFVQLFNKIESTNFIETEIDKLGKKKNGKFRKKAYRVLKKTEYAVTVDTEFTTAWGLFVLRIQALDETTVEMQLKYEYDTYG